MANVEVVNPKQSELAQRYLEVMATLEGEGYASQIYLVGRKNHRLYVTQPGDESHEEYTYREFEQMLEEIEADTKEEVGGETVAESATDSAEAEAAQSEQEQDSDDEAGQEPATDENGEAGATGQGVDVAEAQIQGNRQLDSRFAGLGLNTQLGVDDDEAEPDGGEDTGQASGDGGGDTGSEVERDEVEGGTTLGEGKLSDSGDQGNAGDSPANEGVAVSTGMTGLLGEMLKHTDAGTRGKLALGKDLLTLDKVAKQDDLNQRQAVAVAEEFFAAKGRKFPNRSDRSRMRGTAQAWLDDTGYDLDSEFTSRLYVNDQGEPRVTSDGEFVPIPLGSQDVSALYTVRHLVSPDEYDHNADVLAMCQIFSYRTISKVAKHLNHDNFEAQFTAWALLGASKAEEAAIIWADAISQEGKPEPEFKSIGGISAPLVDQFKGELKEQMTNAAIAAGIWSVFDDGDKPPVTQISHTLELELLMAAWSMLSDRTQYLVMRNQHGVITAEEYAELSGG